MGATRWTTRLRGHCDAAEYTSFRKETATTESTVAEDLTTQSGPDDVGTYDWVATGRTLSGSDRRQVIRALFRVTIENLAALGHLWFRRIPKSVATVRLSLLEPPQSTLAKSAEEAWNELANPDLKAHSIRTWMFARALAAVDSNAVDDNALYCACLLHDYGLERPTSGVDFTLKGADRARLAVLDGSLTHEKAVDLHRNVAEAICRHATAGISASDSNALAYYVMAGSMADLTGLRRWEIGRHAIEYIYGNHPCRSGFTKSFSNLIWNEARAVPSGRFALYSHLGLTLLLKITPHA